jgi:hypothetical protein
MGRGGGGRRGGEDICQFVFLFVFFLSKKRKEEETKGKKNCNYPSVMAGFDLASIFRQNLKQSVLHKKIDENREDEKRLTAKDIQAIQCWCETLHSESYPSLVYLASRLLGTREDILRDYTKAQLCRELQKFGNHFDMTEVALTAGTNGDRFWDRDDPNPTEPSAECKGFFVGPSDKPPGPEFVRVGDGKVSNWTSIAALPQFTNEQKRLFSRLDVEETNKAAKEFPLTWGFPYPFRRHMEFKIGELVPNQAGKLGYQPRWTFDEPVDSAENIWKELAPLIDAKEGKHANHTYRFVLWKPELNRARGRERQLFGSGNPESWTWQDAYRYLGPYIILTKNPSLYPSS